MNDFDYEVAYQKIKSAKLVYELEELVRIKPFGLTKFMILLNLS